MNILYFKKFYKVGEEKKNRKPQNTFFDISMSSDYVSALKRKLGTPWFSNPHFDNHCIRIKPQKYEMLSLCLLKSSESANISHPGIEPVSINRIHVTNELVHVEHL